MMLVHDSSAASAARMHSIEAALKRAEGGSTTPSCESSSANFGADVCYGGGPVIREHTTYLIFWAGPKGKTAFPPGYESTVLSYFEGLAAERGANAADVYAIDAQYGDTQGAGAPLVEFSSAADVVLDTDEFPKFGTKAEGRCTDEAATVAGECITDQQLQAEINKQIEANKARGWAPSLQAIFFVFTPPGVGSCSEPGTSGTGASCAFAPGGYCAYHGDFGGSPPAVGGQTLYANIPDVAKVAGCDAGEYPNANGSAGSSGVDATLDTLSHEHNETITDPLGSQCVEIASKKVCEPNSWIDAIGQEIGDKCLPPETFETYGGPLGGSLAKETAFNQLIDGHAFWLQTEWSNSAGESQGHCVQRLVNTAFNPPSAAQATVPATFDGSPSGSEGDPVDYWIWDFGDRLQTGTPEATVTHTYASPGTYTVTLTAVDLYGNTNTASHTITVGPAPAPSPPPSPPPTPPTNTVTVTVTVPSPPSATIPPCPSSSQHASKGCPATRRPAGTPKRPRRCGSRATSRRGRRCRRSGKRSSRRSRR